jgi:hypothetical protein
MTVAGTANPSAQGQAMINTLQTALATCDHVCPDDHPA